MRAKTIDFLDPLMYRAGERIPTMRRGASGKVRCVVEKSVRDFEYLIPASVDEAIAMRQERGEHSHFIAGGTELVPMIKQHRVEPEFLIELSRIESLQFLHPHESGLSIGPMTTHAEIESSPWLQGPWRALAEASASIREPQIKNLGTIGGNVGYAVPSADSVPPLLTFGALLKLKGPEGERLIPMTEFLVAPYRTSLRAAEVLVEIRLPEAGEGFGSAFCKLARFHGLGLSVVSVAAALKVRGGQITSARIAFGAAAPVPRRVTEAEDFLEGKPPEPSVLREAGRLVSAAAQPRAGSIRATPFYKREVLAPLTERALGLAVARSEGRSERGES